MAELEQIALRVGIAFQQVQQRIAEGRAEGVGDIVAAALTADQQASGRQFLDRLAQGRPDTPNCSASTRSAGRRSPALSVPSRIMVSSWLTISSDKRRWRTWPTSITHTPMVLPPVYGFSRGLCASL